MCGRKKAASQRDAGHLREEEQDRVEGGIEERGEGADHDQHFERDDEVQQDHAAEEGARPTQRVGSFRATMRVSG